jgi:hypothetical protein
MVLSGDGLSKGKSQQAAKVIFFLIEYNPQV